LNIDYVLANDKTHCCKKGVVDLPRGGAPILRNKRCVIVIPYIKAKYQQLIAQGKPKKNASIRKVMVILNSIRHVRLYFVSQS